MLKPMYMGNSRVNTTQVDLCCSFWETICSKFLSYSVSPTMVLVVPDILVFYAAISIK